VTFDTEPPGIIPNLDFKSRAAVELVDDGPNTIVLELSPRALDDPL
jgi:hypothetical protein